MQSFRQCQCLSRRGSLGSAGAIARCRKRAGCNRHSLVVRAQESDKGAREPWDVGRFVRTVLFFNEAPSPSKIVSSILKQPAKILQSLSGTDVEEKKTSILEVLAPSTMSGPEAPSAGSKPIDGIIMVTGATGGVGKRTVRELLARGAKVRALVRDVDAAKEMLSAFPYGPGASLELVAADITQKQTLLPEYFEGVRGLIVCSSVKVAPKEGDTETREKYYQGIKFYDPEIVGDTPETVEYKGIINLMERCKPNLGMEAGYPVLDPSSGSLAIEWGPLDDVVMGGCSQSRLTAEQNQGEDGGYAAVFSGNVTSANNGGFASVRCKNFEPTLDLGAYEGLELRVKGNGQRFKMIIRPDTQWDGIGYCRSFDTVADKWQTIRLPFSEFFGVFRARRAKDSPPLDPSSISSIQLMLSKFEYDGDLNPNFQVGEFSMPIGQITAYMKEPVAPRVVLVGAAGVTRCNRPGINVEEEPPAVRMNDMLGGILTYKLKGEDVVRESGVPFAVVRPCALTEEPKGAPLEFDQGDVIRGKISREDVAELCVELLNQPAAASTSFEVKCSIRSDEPYAPKGDAEPRDWTALIEGAGLKQGVTGKTIDGIYTGREVEEVALEKL